MRTEVGRRAHLVIATLARTSPTRLEILDAVDALWRSEPCGGSTAASARIQCSSAVWTYFRSCLPGSDWWVLATELDLGACVADVVWQHRDGSVLIDEIKTGDPSLSSPRVATQLGGLLAAGTQRWGTSFVGVRFVPLSNPTKTALIRHLSDITTAHQQRSTS